MNELWLAFEGGGTKTRLLLADATGDVIAREVGSCSNQYYIEPARYAREMTRLLKRLAKAAAKESGRVTLAGLAGPMDRALVKATIASVFGRVAFVEAGESEIALAYRGFSDGLAVVAGTGSSCVGHVGGAIAGQSGGFGPQFDDLGSAYWIGREAVSAVVRAEDGRGPATDLQQRLRAYDGIENVWDLLRRCDRNGHVSRQYVAAFAPQVFESAAAGDRVARRICNEAGRHLAELAVATARQLPPGLDPIPVVPSGGVFHAGPLVLNSFKRTLRASGLPLEIQPAVLEPAPGIIRLMARHRNGRSSHVS